VKAIPIATEEGTEYYSATAENAIAGNYPLARFLFVYVNKEPNKPLTPLEREFIKLVLSKAGQEVVLKDGYIPLPVNVIEATYEALGL